MKTNKFKMLFNVLFAGLIITTELAGCATSSDDNDDDDKPAYVMSSQLQSLCNPYADFEGGAGCSSLDDSPNDSELEGCEAYICAVCMDAEDLELNAQFGVKFVEENGASQADSCFLTAINCMSPEACVTPEEKEICDADYDTCLDDCGSDTGECWDSCDETYPCPDSPGDEVDACINEYRTCKENIEMTQ